MKITAIIPLRVSEGLYQAGERLHRIIGTIPSAHYNVLVVDYGTPKEFRSILDSLQEPHVSVRRCDVEDEVFSIGRARDIGVQYAKTEVVMFHDIDFIGGVQAYDDIASEVLVRKMHTNAYEFFCVPVVFLTEFGSECYLETLATSATPEHDFHLRLFEGQRELLQFAAYGSSAIVVNRHHYLSLGGHSRQFFGHGAEDYDVLHRLGTYNAKGPRTAAYYTDTKSNQVCEYRGFRAYFALYGLDVFARGIFLAHLWHPTRAFPGYHQSRRNFALLPQLMRDFDRARIQPKPLFDPYVNPRCLLLLDETSSTFRAIRQAIPSFGDAHILHEDVFADGTDLERYCETHGIERVLFLNPYGNTHRLDLYQHARTTSLKLCVFDRGALPDSWFFDEGGFNFESSSYERAKWDVPISPETLDDVRGYIDALRKGDSTLEVNSPRATPEFVREKLGLGKRKVVFVPFQRPSDSVTRYFAGPVGSVEGFAGWVSALRSALPKSEWVVICKSHPLEERCPDVEDVICGDKFHVHDLLELADVVVLMNSGVGVLGLGFGKPIVCCSESFYVHDGLAAAVSTQGALIQSVLRPRPPKPETVERFYAYLLLRLYSFGASEYRKSIAEDGSQRSIVTEIRFESLRIPGCQRIALGRPRPGVSLDAPLFASFGGRDGIKATLSAGPQAGKSLAARSHQPSTSAHPKSSFRRKSRKLFRNPSGFFKDFLRKRL